MKTKWAAEGLVSAINAYRRFVSPAFAPRCRFEPSCSEFAATAIVRHGLVRGSVLACLRLAKCHPFHPGGIDPVPEKYHIRYTHRPVTLSAKPGGKP